MAKKAKNGFQSLAVWLQGKKTYIFSGFGILTILLGELGIFSEDATIKIAGVLGLGAMITLRDAIKKLQ